MKRLVLVLTTIIVVVMFSGCAGAIQTAIKKRNLDVQTKMSASIFLEPVAPEEQIVYVKVRNTTDKDINIESAIKQSFTQKGFKIVANPKKANFMVQINLLQVGKSDARSAQDALANGFGGAIVGSSIGKATGGKGYAGGLIGAAMGVVGDALVDDVYFTIITDIEIRQRPLEGETIKQSSNMNAKQGISGNTQQIVKSTNVRWKKYRTRVVGTATQVNLKFIEAKPKLVKGLVRSLSGLL
jgi:hypothetical protein